MNKLSNETLYEIISHVYEDEYDINFHNLCLVNKQFKYNVELYVKKRQRELKTSIRDMILGKKESKDIDISVDDEEILVDDYEREADIICVIDEQCPEKLKTSIGYYALVAKKIGDREIRFNNMF